MSKNPAGSRKAKHFRSILIWLAAILLLTAAVMALPSFRLQKITAATGRIVSSDELIKASKLDLNQHLLSGLGGSPRHLFELRYRSAEEAITDAIPYVKTAEVKMFFPGSINISYEERVEVAYVSIPDGCVMIDKDGYALSINKKVPADVPVIEGIRVVSLQLGRPLTVDVTDAMQGAVTLMGAIIDADRDERTKVNLMNQVRKIRPAGSNLIYMTIILPSNGQELIVLAERGGNLSEDMLWLRFAMQQQALQGHGKGILDMTGSRIIFRPDGG